MTGWLGEKQMLSVVAVETYLVLPGALELRQPFRERNKPLCAHVTQSLVTQHP